jgi:hypothetical protein
LTTRRQARKTNGEANQYQYVKAVNSIESATTLARSHGRHAAAGGKITAPGYCAKQHAGWPVAIGKAKLAN